MSGINESNVDNYKTEHECDEHWELRRKFLLIHSDKFNVDELMCLAQVFTNVEFLGCRYPKETMQMVAELSKEVVGEYRDKQKNRLQRTFVGASDAASSKAKGQSRPEKLNDPGNSRQFKQDNFSYPGNSRQTPQNNYQSLSTNFKRSHELSSSQDRCPDVKKKKLDTSKHNTDVVLLEYLNDTPQSIISRAANMYKIDLDWKFDYVNKECTCSLFFNNHKVAQGQAPNQKDAKKEASAVALKEMQKIYYTIKVTKNLTPTVVENIKAENPDTSSNLDDSIDDAIGNDNIGSKMMKMMGWSGGGLGKSSQGITEPVSVNEQMTREGLGLKIGAYNMQLFKKKCNEVLRNYMNGNTSTDMVFSPCFTNEERSLIHQLAKQLGLKSQSYGPKAERILTISRKIRPQELVNELLEHGGVTEKYQLIEPTGNS